MKIIAETDGSNAAKPLPAWWDLEQLVLISGRLFHVWHDVTKGGKEQRDLIEHARELPPWLDNDQTAAALAVIDGTEAPEKPYTQAQEDEGTVIADHAVMEDPNGDNWHVKAGRHHTVFFGPDAEERAREYALWKNAANERSSNVTVIHKGRPKQLPDGNWGSVLIGTPGDKVNIGDRVEVRTKIGQPRGTHIITEIVGAGDDGSAIVAYKD